MTRDRRGRGARDVRVGERVADRRDELVREYSPSRSCASMKRSGPCPRGIAASSFDAVRVVRDRRAARRGRRCARLEVARRAARAPSPRRRGTRATRRPSRGGSPQPGATTSAEQRRASDNSERALHRSRAPSARPRLGDRRGARSTASTASGIALAGAHARASSASRRATTDGPPRAQPAVRERLEAERLDDSTSSSATRVAPSSRRHEIVRAHADGDRASLRASASPKRVVVDRHRDAAARRRRARRPSRASLPSSRFICGEPRNVATNLRARALVDLERRALLLDERRRSAPRACRRASSPRPDRA